jgi:NAD(P)-binding Rossmann-like domain
MQTTDYLVIGAGAAGMAITDALLSHSNATVTIVDRRHAPGGHWLDAYSFVRLHQPSTFYGVDSTPLGQDIVEVTGWNAGHYELASADDLRSYYLRVMERHFLPSGRVSFFPGCDYVGNQRVVSRLSGASWDFYVTRKIIDTTYLEGAIPATSAPPFDVAAGVRCVPAGDITHLDERPDDYVVIGAGKTALDTCVWLLGQGVAASSISWVKPRECWWLNRRFFQPHTGLPEMYRGLAIQLEAMAQGTSIADLMARLEAEGITLRVDTAVTPTMYRGAVIGEAEIEMVRQIHQVTRLGHVRSITRDTITLDQGQVPTSPRSLHIHCAARGLARPPLRPIFEPGRMTVQPFLRGFACFQFAMLGVAEALLDTDAEKNLLFPPIAYWDNNIDFVTGFLATMANTRARTAYPALASWANSSRLNPLAGIDRFSSGAGVTDSRERIKRSGALAVETLTRLVHHC